MQVHYSSRDLDQLNVKVRGLLNETHTVESVLDTIAQHKLAIGDSSEVKDAWIKPAVSTVNGILNMRLRESASDVLYAGKHVSRDDISRFVSSIQDSEKFSVAGFSNGSRLKEFRQLLRNKVTQSRVQEVVKGDLLQHVEWMVRQLQEQAESLNTFETLKPQEHLDASATAKALEHRVASARLTETSLAAVCRGLLKAMRQQSDACNLAISLDVAGHVSSLLVGSASAPITLWHHPELQLYLTLLLAEVVLCAEARSDDAQATDALDSLIRALRTSLHRKQHAKVWAALVALQKASAHPVCCLRLLAKNIIPLIRDASNFYNSENGQLSLPVPAHKVASVRSEHAPLFLKKPSAFDDRTNLKDGRLTHSRSLTSLEQTQPDSVDWLAGNSVTDLSAVKRSAPNSRPMHAGNRRRSLQSAGNLQLQAAAEHRAESKGFSGQSPSLLWLACEDAVDVDAFYRSCDKSFMLLQANRLLRHLEKIEAQFATFSVEKDGEQITFKPDDLLHLDTFINRAH